jgi:hypothetical protein
MQQPNTNDSMSTDIVAMPITRQPKDVVYRDIELFYAFILAQQVPIRKELMDEYFRTVDYFVRGNNANSIETLARVLDCIMLRCNHPMTVMYDFYDRLPQDYINEFYLTRELQGELYHCFLWQQDIHPKVRDFSIETLSDFSQFICSFLNNARNVSLLRIDGKMLEDMRFISRPNIEYFREELIYMCEEFHEIDIYYEMLKSRCEDQFHLIVVEIISEDDNNRKNSIHYIYTKGDPEHCKYMISTNSDEKQVEVIVYGRAAITIQDIGKAENKKYNMRIPIAGKMQTAVLGGPLRSQFVSIENGTMYHNIW